MLEGQGHCGPSWERREANKQEGEAVGERKERQATAVQRHIALKKKKIWKLAFTYSGKGSFLTNT